jgi:hypothetical protein
MLGLRAPLPTALAVGSAKGRKPLLLVLLLVLLVLELELV